MLFRMVSVIVPVYQVSDYVERCVRSVMAQRYTDIECIIVDDATTDDSIEKCEALIGDYTGEIVFRIIHHDHNRGLSAARNTGTEVANGDYLYYLDSDDYIAPDCIERLITAMAGDHTVEMVQGNCLMTDSENEGKLFSKDCTVEIRDHDDARKAFFKDRYIYISVWNKLLKRSFVEDCKLYCREGLVFEDLLWFFYLLKNLKRACLCEEVTYFYCIRQDSITTAAKPDAIRCYVVMFDEIFHHLTAGREREEIEGFLYYFIKRFISYVSVVPAFKDTIRLYMSKAKQYHCWYAYMVLFAADCVRRIGNPSKLLEWLNNVRWKLKDCK